MTPTHCGMRMWHDGERLATPTKAEGGYPLYEIRSALWVCGCCGTKVAVPVGYRKVEGEACRR